MDGAGGGGGEEKTFSATGATETATGESESVAAFSQFQIIDKRGPPPAQCGAVPTSAVLVHWVPLEALAVLLYVN